MSGLNFPAWVGGFFGGIFVGLGRAAMEDEGRVGLETALREEREVVWFVDLKVDLMEK
jgi:hypothetical protein